MGQHGSKSTGPMTVLHPAGYGVTQLKALSVPLLVDENGCKHTFKRHGAQAKAGKQEPSLKVKTTLSIQVERESSGPENIPIFFLFIIQTNKRH